LGWRPVWNSQGTVVTTANWYKVFYTEQKMVSRSDILKYASAAKTLDLPGFEDA